MFIISDLISESVAFRFKFTSAFRSGPYDDQIEFLDQYIIKKYLQQDSFALIETSKIIMRFTFIEEDFKDSNELMEFAIKWHITDNIPKIYKFKVSPELPNYVKLRCI